MKCPQCHEDHDKVVDSRPGPDGVSIRRRRQCLECGQRFTTYERIEHTTVKVIKRDGTREGFDRAKLKIGLEKACWKRPVSEAQLEEIIMATENRLETDFDGEVDARIIGDVVMDLLRHVDQVAYVRFASVYRKFEDVRDFVDELRPMLDERK